MSTEFADEDTGTAGLFEDPEGYYPPTPPPTMQSHTLRSGRTINLHLVGYSPLEAHHLWNGSRVVADFFESHLEEVQGRTFLELGAGAGLPSIVAGLLGARKVVVTDFPDADLVATMWRNVREAGLAADSADASALTPDGVDGRHEGVDTREKGDGRIDGNCDDDDDGIVIPQGYVWGGDPAPLLAMLPADVSGQRPAGFDTLILADLVFRHSEHGRLVDSIESTMRRRRGSKAFVFFTSYRPWLQQKDLAFFDVARERGFEVEKVLERKMDKPLFEDDPGDKDILKTVTGFTVRWPSVKCEDG